MICLITYGIPQVVISFNRFLSFSSILFRILLLLRRPRFRKALLDFLQPLPIVLHGLVEALAISLLRLLLRVLLTRMPIIQLALCVQPLIPVLLLHELVHFLPLLQLLHVLQPLLFRQLPKFLGRVLMPIHVPPLQIVDLLPNWQGGVFEWHLERQLRLVVDDQALPLQVSCFPLKHGHGAQRPIQTPLPTSQHIIQAHTRRPSHLGATCPPRQGGRRHMSLHSAMGRETVIQLVQKLGGTILLA